MCGAEGEPLPSRRSGIRRRRCIAGRDDENRANLALIIAKTEFLLEVLVIAFDAPAQFGGVRQSLRLMLVGKVDSQFGFARRPFDQAPLLRPWR